MEPNAVSSCYYKLAVEEPGMDALQTGNANADQISQRDMLNEVNQGGRPNEPAMRGEHEPREINDGLALTPREPPIAQAPETRSRAAFPLFRSL